MRYFQWKSKSSVYVVVSLSHDDKNEETPRPSAKILTNKNSVEKPMKIILRSSESPIHQ